MLKSKISLTDLRKELHKDMKENNKKMKSSKKDKTYDHESFQSGCMFGRRMVYKKIIELCISGKGDTC